jgi:alpha-L-rhamnosidase
MTKKILMLASLSSAVVVLGATVSAADLTATSLRCEYVENPLGVDVPSPRLFWKLKSTTRGQRQTAYQILVTSSAGALAKNQGDLWDSGKVASDETIQIPYRGRPLKSSQQVFWKVCVWPARRSLGEGGDTDGKTSAWSEPACWTMGLLKEADWQAKWIAANTSTQTVLLRREFVVKPELKRAIAHVCGLGQYEVSLNGRKVGDDLLTPGWTKYDKTCLYDTYDITAMLREGRNAVGLFLGNGMYNVTGGRYTKFKGSFGPLKVIGQVRLEYADGTTDVIGTDDRWRTNPGPITFSCIYGGEDYDARLEPRGWNDPGFDDSKWDAAQVVNGPGGKLKGLSCAAPPIRAFDVLRPVKVTPLKSGVTVYDLGQNVSLMPRIRVKGPAGTVVRIIPAELLQADGTVDRGSSGHNRPAYWQYTLAGSDGESWFPKFFYHGCRYLQVECTPASEGGELPVVESLEGVVVHSSSTPVGEFSCSNELFNRIHALVRWAQRSNMMSVLTDCPHRERLGWLEQYHLNGPSLRYEFDLAQLFTKGMNDMADSQLANGLVPDIAPEYTVFQEGFRDSPEWGSAFVLAPWQQYEWTGDVELLRRHYDGMKRYAAYLGSQATNHIVSYGLGDWYDIGQNRPGRAQLTPVPLTATAFYYYDTRILARTAALLGHAGEARKYGKLAARIRTAFNQTFFNPTNNQYATGSQCANAIPLVMNMVEPANRTAVVNAIVADVQKRGNAITAGDVGYRYLLRALAEGGRSDVIFDMNNQSDKPGYGYQLKMGATSLTEAWDADRRSSQNHFMLGQINEWFYHDLAGIGCDPDGPGFKKIIIKPQPVGDLTWAKASYDSVRGPIVSDWKRDGGKFTLNVTIPANTTATVYVPAKNKASVTEGGKPLDKAEGVKFLRMEKDRAVFAVQAGRYSFVSD